MDTNEPLKEVRDGNVTVVVFSNELKQLDELNVVSIGDRLLEIADGLTRPNLVLDLNAIEFFGSSFIEALFRVWKRLNTKPAAQFGIAGLQPYCREILEVTHLDKVWPLFDSSEAAAKAFNHA